MRIVHIIDSIGNPASGPSYSVPRLCEALADLGHDVELHAVRTVGDSATTVPVVIYGGPRPFRHLGVSPGLQWALPQILATADIVHGHGVWMLPNITPFLPKRSLAKRVLSPAACCSPRRWPTGPGASGRSGASPSGGRSRASMCSTPRRTPKPTRFGPSGSTGW